MAISSINQLIGPTLALKSAKAYSKPKAMKSGSTKGTGFGAHRPKQPKLSPDPVTVIPISTKDLAIQHLNYTEGDFVPVFHCSNVNHTEVTPYDHGVPRGWSGEHVGFRFAKNTSMKRALQLREQLTRAGVHDAQGNIVVVVVDAQSLQEEDPTK
jgi:hypothetical protein